MTEIRGLPSPERLAVLGLDAILELRRELVAALAFLDQEIERRGVRPLGPPRRQDRHRELALLAAVLLGAHDAEAIRARTGQTLHATHQMLAKLTRLGRLVRIDHGRYELPRRPDAPGAESPQAQGATS